jgi:hypothetical protein
MSNNYVVSYAENKEFVNLLGTLFNIVDGLATDDRINSGEYNEIAMTIKNLFQMRQTIQGNIVYKRMYNRSTTHPPQPRKTEEYKLNDINNNPNSQYVVCDECDTILVKDSLYNHIKTKKCLGIRQSKVGAIKIKKVKSIKYVKLQVYNYKFAPIFDNHNKKLSEIWQTNPDMVMWHHYWIKVNDKWIIKDENGVEESKSD